MHIIIPKYFNWEQELVPLSLITKQIIYVHTFFIAFVILLIGLLCLTYSHQLVHDPFGRVISFGLFGFWLTRLIFQFFVYSPKVWRGKRFETVMHVIFSITWLYFTMVFLFSYLVQRWFTKQGTSALSEHCDDRQPAGQHLVGDCLIPLAQQQKGKEESQANAPEVEHGSKIRKGEINVPDTLQDWIALQKVVAGV